MTRSRVTAEAIVEDWYESSRAHLVRLLERRLLVVEKVHGLDQDGGSSQTGRVSVLLDMERPPHKLGDASVHLGDDEGQLEESRSRPEDSGARSRMMLCKSKSFSNWQDPYDDDAGEPLSPLSLASRAQSFKSVKSNGTQGQVTGERIDQDKQRERFSSRFSGQRSSKKKNSRSSRNQPDVSLETVEQPQGMLAVARNSVSNVRTSFEGAVRTTVKFATEGSARASRVRTSQALAQTRADHIGTVLEAARMARTSDVSEQPHVGKSCMSRLLVDPTVERYLDVMMGVIILLNVIEMGFAGDVARDWAGWHYFDALFSVTFFLEFFIRLVMRGCYSHFVSHFKWTLFDGVIVGLAIFELYVGVTDGKTYSEIAILRVVRLLRLVRIVKIIRLPMFRDLLMMCDGLIDGARTLFWSIVLLLVPVYAAAVLLRETIGRDEVEDRKLVQPFTTLPWAFFTTFRCIMGDCSHYTGQPLPVLISERFGWVFAICYVGLIIITSFGLFNVIIAIYVENVVVTARKSESIQRHRRLSDQRRLNTLLGEVIHEFVEYCFNMVQNGSGDPGASQADLDDMMKSDPHVCDIAKAAEVNITRQMFDDVTHSETMTNLLDQLDVSHEDRRDLFRVLDSEGAGVLSLAEIIDGIIRLRGEPRRSDVVANGLAIRSLQKRVMHDAKWLNAEAELHASELEGMRQDYELFMLRVTDQLRSTKTITLKIAEDLDDVKTTCANYYKC